MNLLSPANPLLAHLKRQAKRLKRDWLKREAHALKRVRAAHPRLQGISPQALPDWQPKLADCLLVLAREAGFASWPLLRVAITSARGDLAQEFVSLACLCFDDPHYDHRAFHTRAHQLLEEHRWIAQTDLWAAAAAGHVRALTDLLDEQPNRVNAAGPYGWTPLLCACYSRAKPVAEEFSTFAAASLLLERGADPNAYTLKGNADERLDQTPRRYAVLSGVFGGGTTGPANEPPHPSWRALAEMLLAYGANPADEEALRHNTPAALPVLLEHGLKPDATGSDGTTLMGSALARAAMRGDLEHVQLLVAHGARLEETV